MITIPPEEDLGHALLSAGFRPLPYVAHDGALIGTELWRMRSKVVECLRLYPSGIGLAVRALAIFDYRRPFDHGPVINTHTGQAATALNWLLASTPLSPPEQRNPPN